MTSTGVTTEGRSTVKSPQHDDKPNAPRTAAMPRPRVLMVTGSYYPDVTGGGLQCRQLVQALRERVAFTVWTTVTGEASSTDRIDDVPVHRIHVDPMRAPSAISSAVHLVRLWLRQRKAFDIVHLHGFSKKSVLIVALAKLSGKRVMIKLTSVGHDDPPAMRTRGQAAWWSYARADRFVGVSPRFEELYADSSLPRDRFRLIPNGVDLERFRPGEVEERRRLRGELSLPPDMPLVLFVGFFSREKHPDLLFEAWRRVQASGGPASSLVFVGAARSRYAEIDPALSRAIREQAVHLGLAGRVIFVERSHEIEQYYRCADVFAMPSSREGLPNALLEAMATGLPCVATQLAGVTDTLIDHGVSGLLVPPDDASALEQALVALLGDPMLARRLGQTARSVIEQRYSMTEVARRYDELYRELAG